MKWLPVMVPLLLMPSSIPAHLAEEMLAAHNAVRARVHVPPLVWSAKLAEYAQHWADTLLAEGKFYHHPKSPYGENLFEIEGAQVTPTHVVEAWASEAKDFDYKSGKCRGMCGHYTQIVWRGSKAVGCAMARGGKKEVWVCNYDPPGNYLGQRPY